MSDSDDFGGFGGTTPEVARKLASATAGPSRMSATETATNKAKRKAAVAEHVSIDSDEDEVRESKTAKSAAAKRGTATAAGKRRRKDDDDGGNVEESDGGAVAAERSRRARRNRDEDEDESEDVQEIVAPSNTTTKKGRGGSRKPASTSRIGGADAALEGSVVVNGTGRGTSPPAGGPKGRGKVKPRPVTNGKASSSKRKQDADVMDVDVVEVMDVDEDEGLLQDDLANAINAAQRSGKQSTARSKQKDDEAERLKEQLRQANVHIEDLKRQLQELHQIRVTEPEMLLERIETQHSAERQASEALIKDLREQLQRKDPLLRTGRNAVFELLTREEADKEMQGLKGQVESYKEGLRDRDKLLKQKDEEVSTLEATANDLRYELQMEIERGKELVKRAPDSVTKPRAGGVNKSDDPKMAELVKFYEDLTNVLVPAMKVQTGRYLGQDEWILTCIFSYRDVVNQNPESKSLNFRLRLCHDPISGLKGEPRTMADLTQSIHYTPAGLENETEEFVESLGFLNKTFIFERDQLSLFARTLHDVVSGEGKGDDDDGPDDGIQLVG